MDNLKLVIHYFGMVLFGVGGIIFLFQEGRMAWVSIPLLVVFIYFLQSVLKNGEVRT